MDKMTTKCRRCKEPKEHSVLGEKVTSNGLKCFTVQCDTCGLKSARIMGKA